MKRNIMAALTLAAASTVFAQGYKVIVTTTDGVKQEFITEDVSKITFSNTPEYMPANMVIGADYTINSSRTLGNYNLAIGNSNPDNMKDPVEIGDYQVILSLTAPADADPFNAVLPEGYYRMGKGDTAYTWDVTRSAFVIRLAEGADGVSTQSLSQGTVDVRKGDKGYDIRFEFVTLDGTAVDVQFEGDIEFAPGNNVSNEFLTDQDITLTGGQARIYANWYYPFASDGKLELYSGTFDENNNQVEGYWVEVEVYMPKYKEATPTTKCYLPDGLYTIDSRKNILYYTNRPYSFIPGHMVDLWGTEYPVSTQVTYLKDGKRTHAFITDGTMTVSNNGTVIECEFIAENGVKLNATFEGNLVFANFIDNSKEQLPVSTLEENVTLEFPASTEINCWNLGDYIVDGVNNYMFTIGDRTNTVGDFLTFELLCEGELADGTYEINDALTNLTGLKGCLDPGGELLFSWYGDLSSTTSDGVQEILAPITGGTITITSLDNWTKTFTFNLNDNAGHTITGSYNGGFTIEDNKLNAPVLRSGAQPVEVKAHEMTSFSKIR